MQRRTKLAGSLILGMSLAVLLSEPAFPRQKNARSGSQKFAAAASSPIHAKPAVQSEPGKVILVLQTRDHRITVYGGKGAESHYSVATLQGIALAEGLSVNELKSRFPDLHDIVTGIAWAGM